MTVVARLHESFHRRIGGVVPHDGEQGVDEDRLAVATCAIQKQQSVLCGQPRQTIPSHALQIAQELFVTTCDLLKERKPLRTLALRACGRDLGHAVNALVRTKQARLQLDDPFGRVELPWVWIPLVDVCRMLGV